MSGDTWLTALQCGHGPRLPHELKPGDWITCAGRGCQGQRRVMAVTPVRYEVPAPGETGVQGTLWEVAA